MRSKPTRRNSFGFVHAQLFGGSVASRIFEAQVTEVHARIAALNLMTYLGMPVSARMWDTAP